MKRIITIIITFALQLQIISLPINATNGLPDYLPDETAYTGKTEQILDNDDPGIASINSSNCPHKNLGVQYSEAEHPHKYYRPCLSCGQHIYIGGHATKAHGTGAWGSGTCPSCGTHSYVKYCDAAHPHRDYKICTACQNKVYLNSYTTKKHGTGATGSGTCPSCGTHSYVKYCEAEHPHRDYNLCTGCQKKVYLNSYTTKKHGTGAWGSGTCPSCGSHNFQDPSQQAIAIHPHKYIRACSCGQKQNIGEVAVENCATCNNLKRTVTGQNSASCPLFYLDGDNGMGAPILLTVILSIQYKETYRKEYGNYYSYTSNCKSTLTQVPPWAEGITFFSNPEVKYYKSDGVYLFSHSYSTEYGIDDKNRTSRYFYNNGVPGYVIAGASAFKDGALTFGEVSVKVNLV